MRVHGFGLVVWLLSVVTQAYGAGGGRQMLRVGDDRLQVTLSLDGGTLRETQVAVVGQTQPVVGVAWSAEVDGSWLLPERADATGSGPGVGDLRRRASFAGRSGPVRWEMTYEVTGRGRITKSLTLTAETSCTVQRVAMWDVQSQITPKIARTGLQDIAAFYRSGAHSLFVSLDFPYSRIVDADGRLRVTFPPHEHLAPGQRLTSHSLTVGAAELTGRERYGFDDGEVDAMDAYIQERFAPRFQRPMLTSCSMNNRYTQVEGDWVFYTMKDHPTLSFHTDLLKRDLTLMRKLGMEYYQVFPGVFDWAPGDPDPKIVNELVAFSRRHGMRIGDYSSPSGLFCPHYNEYRNSLSKPEWRIVDRNGSIGSFSLGVKEYVDYYIGTVVPNCAKFGFELHNLDFLNIAPDYSTKRPYPPGGDSVYHQVKGLVRLMEALNSVSPNMMTWSNSGNFDQLLPKIAWANPNLYLTDPFIGMPWQGLNMTRLLDDSRRDQMVSLHYSRFLPYRFFTNYQYFFCQNSIVPDLRNYQYGALSTLAVTPNLGLGDIRPWLDTLPQRDVASVIEFYAKWTKLVKRNYGMWTKTYSVGESPGMGSVEIYGHAKGNRGFVFVVNPQYWSRTVQIPLDASLGFTGQGQCEIVERHPVERLLLTHQGPFAALGSHLTVQAPAQQVLVLEVRPAPARVSAPRLYGLPGSVEATEKGYLVKTSRPQGITERFAVLYPTNGKRVSAASVRREVPKQPNRLWAETLTRIVGGDDRGLAVDVTFRRRPAPSELRKWRVRPGSLQSGTEKKWQAGLTDGTDLVFPLFSDALEADSVAPIWDNQADRLGLGPLANFCGAYVDNAFSEDQETWIDLTPGPGKPAAGKLAVDEGPTSKRALSPLARDSTSTWWLQTNLQLPFMWWGGGAQPPFAEHTMLVLPLLRTARTGQIRAWVNGSELNVQAYRYPRNAALFCYYADLVGSSAHVGDNALVVYYEATGAP